MQPQYVAMCYYNGQFVSRAEFIRLKEMERDIKWLQQRDLQSGFDYSDWPIVIPSADKKGIEVEMAHWEFIPYWIKDIPDLQKSRLKFTTLNAKAETLLSSKMYRNSALNHRCLVLSSGFYEWRHYKPEGAKKEIAYPYYITLPGQDYFYMAGIYNTWTDKTTGETMDTFAIVTTEANELLAQVHNTKKRQPTILPENEASAWLFGNNSEQDILRLAAYQLPANQMHAVTIAKDFRTSIHPNQIFDYSDLPPIVVK